ncbi:hypothetical protein LTR36_009258 [Oleoguttula mirabilis]|uniref:Calponin-homology (CH) domain-containing protein n=1 Tax=Oleoguttula mirabilis TaxID=1507867 RepID=A0AAV9J6W6_9PEZI|nr:hypothetical protein LTR36_009258 [Oleoguttula mirabilis]
MASVSSLDADMRNLRLGRYTPQAAKEVRTWMEETLGEQLAPGDLLDALKDGVALCKLANLALPPPGIKYKKSGMPFIQMENISHFLRACEMPPLNMPAHDRFLTVDLFESKDPAQVLQCLGAFSRRAHAASPSRFRTTIGPAKKGGVISPTNTGSAMSNGSFRSGMYGQPANPTKPSAARAMSPTLTGGSTGSQNSSMSPGPVSSWSSRKDEGNTSPAWNIHQYGYMGGASQGNQGISFGARRQITSAGPTVPNAGDKLRKRKEKEEEEQRLKQQAEEAEYKRRTERDAEEERERAQEERRWEDETRRIREEERKRVEEQKRQWEEQERRWKDEEEARRKEDAEIQSHLLPKKPPERPRVGSSSILRGQSLAQYQKDQSALSRSTDSSAEETPEQARVRELEKQLEEARERERQYQTEREERLRQGKDWSRPSTATTDTARPQSEASWTGDERDYLRQQWQNGRGDAPAKPAAAVPGAQKAVPIHQQPQQHQAPPSLPSRPLPQPAKVESESEAEAEAEEEADALPSLPSRRPLPHSDSASSIPRFDPESAPTSSPLGSRNRPLPTPDKEFEAYSPMNMKPNRTETFLAANAPPAATKPRVSSSQEAGDAALEQQRDRDRRLAGQQKTKAGGWASKSLLEREMERERERQREWEADQQQGGKVASTTRDGNQSKGAGQGQGQQGWDVNQYGYTGGDNMNRGSSTGSGIDFGGRRQILGPRPQK